MRKALIVLVLGCGLMASGCATRLGSAVTSANLEGGNVIYFEQTDRVPRSLMVSAWENVSSNTYVRSIPPEAIAELVAEMVKLYPELAQIYSRERMENALIGRRILIKWNGGTNELESIKDIIMVLGGSIENWTPQLK
jgi:hypothetical protein